MSFRPKCLAQILEGVAQVGQGGGFGAVRPEGAGQPVALDFLAGAQNEQGEEPLGLARVQTGERLAAPARLERTQETDLQA